MQQLLTTEPARYRSLGIDVRRRARRGGGTPGGEKKIVGFATSSKDWFPIQGTFQVVN
jgi:hypothetical protein